MKSPHLLVLALAPLAAASPMSDRISPEQLEARRAASDSPVARLGHDATASAEPSRPTEQSLLAGSTILHDGTHWTLVPRGAVLHLPDQHQDKVEERPLGKLLPWREFLTRNRAWVRAEELSLRQAEGIEPLDPRRVAYWTKQDKVIVAVHLGGPISARDAAADEQTASNR